MSPSHDQQMPINGASTALDASRTLWTCSNPDPRQPVQQDYIHDKLGLDVTNDRIDITDDRIDDPEDRIPETEDGLDVTDDG